MIDCQHVGFATLFAVVAGSAVVISPTSAAAVACESAKIDPRKKALLEALAGDPSVRTLVPVAFGKLKPRNGSDDAIRRRNNEAKAILFRAASSAKGSVTLRVESRSDEGNPYARYLTVEEGKVTSVEDFSRDPFGGCDIQVHSVATLQRGYFVEMPGRLRFVPLTAEAVPEGAYLILKCSPQKELYY